MALDSKKRGLQIKMLLGGIACIAGGEALCLLGPYNYQRIVAVLCHGVLYLGIALCGIATMLGILELFHRPPR